MPKLDQWDRRRVELARFVASWSKDPNAQVGSVIADARGRVIALGYNGFAIGVEDRADRLTDQHLKLEMVVHAEENAVLIAGKSAENATIYVVGKPVCARCAGVIIQSGINRVVAARPALVEEIREALGFLLDRLSRHAACGTSTARTSH
jgi:dCMP deaminase